MPLDFTWIRYHEYEAAEARRESDDGEAMLEWYRRWMPTPATLHAHERFPQYCQYEENDLAKGDEDGND